MLNVRSDLFQEHSVIQSPWSCLVRYTYGTSTVPSEAIAFTIDKSMDFTPCGIRTHFGLNKPIYEHTAAYGHFGRPPEDDGVFSREPTDLVAALIKIVKLVLNSMIGFSLV